LVLKVVPVPAVGLDQRASNAWPSRSTRASPDPVLLA